MNKNLKNTQNPSCEHLFFQFMTALSYIYSSQIAILEQQGKKKTHKKCIRVHARFAFSSGLKSVVLYYRFSHV